jgi:hypothetical protein
MKRARPRLFNDENIALMRDMAREGKSVSQIAREIGSTVSSVRTWASRLKIQLRSNRVFDYETISLMRAMAREGKSSLQVANKIGSTAGSVRVVASRLGIRFRRGEKGA